MNSTLRLYDEADKVVEYMYRKEEASFLSSIEVEDTKDVFIFKLKKHIFYSIIVIKYKGNSRHINEWFNEYWYRHCEMYSNLF